MSILSGEEFLVFSVVLLVTSFLYSSVGHGGASGYLALMALFGFSVFFMKSTALTLNIAVSAVSFIFFQRNNFFRWKLFFPFAVSSIPAAFIGGLMSISPVLYKQILGVFLLIAILRMTGFLGKRRILNKKVNLPLGLLIGFVIGLFSGMIGIGGGIILSPVILLLGWGDVKEAAAVSALFILVNSVAGLMGFYVDGNVISNGAFYLLPMVLLGGVAGAFYGSMKFSHRKLNFVLQFVLLIAFVKLMVT